MPLFMEITQTGLIAIGAVLVVWQVRQDHRRRRQDATVNILVQIRAQRADVEHELSRIGIQFPLGDADIAKLKKDDAARISAKHLLSLLEYISAATLNGVFDIKMLDKMSGAKIVSLWMDWLPYIETITVGSNDSHRVYDQFEELARLLANNDKNLHFRAAFRSHLPKTSRNSV